VVVFNILKLQIVVNQALFAFPKMKITIDVILKKITQI